ncbi:unnamed protein product [Penicillium manginii]
MRFSRSDEENEPLISLQSKGPCTLSPTSIGYDDDMGGTGRFFESNWARFRQPSPAWIICLYSIYVMVFGILTVPELNSIFVLICHQQYSESENNLKNPIGQSESKGPDLFKELNNCLGNEHAQVQLSQFLLYSEMTSGLLGALSTPILSSLSDRIGRRRILACTAVGPLIKEVLLLFLLWYPDSIDVYWLLVGYAIEGLSGGLIVSISTSQASIADLVPLKDRAKIFGYLQAGLFCTLVLGPIIAGVLLTTFGSFQFIFEVAACSHLLLVLTFSFILPESRQKHSTGSHMADTEQRSGESTIQSIWSSFESIRGSSISRRRNMAVLAFVDFVVFGIYLGISPLQLAYPGYLFHWTPTIQSVVMALTSSWSVLVLIVIFPTAMMLVRRCDRQASGIPLLKFGEMGAIKFCLMLQVLGYIGISLAPTPGAFIISSLVVASSAPISPLLTSCLTAYVSDDQIGQLLGILSFLHAISRIVMPAVMNAIYSRTVGIFPAPLFIVLAIFQGVSLLATMGVKADVV